MQELKSEIQEYNELVDEWNERFGGTCKCQPISENANQESTIGRLRDSFSEGMSTKQRLKTTRHYMSDYAARKPGESSDGELSRSELALILEQKADWLLGNI